MYLLISTSCVCIFFAGICAEECYKGVEARRETLIVQEGSSLSLSCVVEHCGTSWDGYWVWTNSTEKALIPVKNTTRHHLTRANVSANRTQMVLKFLSVDQLDEGDYRCTVKWEEGLTDQGHWKIVNITTAVPSQRNFLHRVYIWIGAFLCLPIILGLARCLSSEAEPRSLPSAQYIYAVVNQGQAHSAPQPPPRRAVPQKHNASSQKAPAKSTQKTEVVYADISQDALSKQGATRQPAESTVYSDVRFT